MEKSKDLTKEQTEIAEVILKNFKPGTVEEHDDIIEIDTFIDLWRPIDRPKLSDIEEVMKLLGFKDEFSRQGLEFCVLIVEKEAD